MNGKWMGVFCALLLAVHLTAGAKEQTTRTITMEAGGQTFTIALEDNDTARAFWDGLPITMEMSELNGNEKFFDLAHGLPHAAQAVGSVEAGDLMLFGSHCVVLFYEGFSTGYSYTRIGKTEDTEGLEEALGSGGVEVTFAKQI